MIQEGALPKIALPPGLSTEIKIPFKEPEPTPGTEYTMRINFKLAEDQLWAEKGYLLAWDQIEIPLDSPPLPQADYEDMPGLKKQESETAFSITGSTFQIKIGKNSGALESFKFQGKELITRPLVPNFWRAPTDNDEGNRMPERLSVWRTAGPDRVVVKVEAQQPDPYKIEIRADFLLPAGRSELSILYTVYGSGDVVVENAFKPGMDLPELPRFGMQMRIPDDYGTITWYGRGPHESYWDRKTGASVGIFSGPVDDQIHPYIRPQEVGNKTDVRWVTLTDSEGDGILVVGAPLLSISVWPFALQDLEQADHTFELNRRNFLTFNIDYKQMGVGGDNSWGARPHPEYLLLAKPYSYCFRLTPLSGENEGSLEKLIKRSFN